MSKLYYLGRKVLVPADVWPDEPVGEGKSGWEGKSNAMDVNNLNNFNLNNHRF
jgi:hypothetical protein